MPVPAEPDRPLTAPRGQKVAFQSWNSVARPLDSEIRPESVFDPNSKLTRACPIQPVPENRCEKRPFVASGTARLRSGPANGAQEGAPRRRRHRSRRRHRGRPCGLEETRPVSRQSPDPQEHRRPSQIAAAALAEEKSRRGEVTFAVARRERRLVPPTLRPGSPCARFVAWLRSAGLGGFASRPIAAEGQAASLLAIPNPESKGV